MLRYYEYRGSPNMYNIMFIPNNKHSELVLGGFTSVLISNIIIINEVLSW